MKPISDLTSVPRTEASDAMQVAASAYESRFGIEFASLVYLDAKSLCALHSNGVNALGRRIVIASDSDPTILDEMKVLTRVANQSGSKEDRVDYLEALLRIYKKLPSGKVASAETLFVGPEREGRILADSLGYLASPTTITVHAKRIPFHNGLIVGLSETSKVAHYSHCVIIDGAVASGATIIAILIWLKPFVSSFEVRCAHGTAAGISAIAQFAECVGVDLQMFVGHLSGELNEKYYAVDEDDSNRLVVGDLGDIIDG